MRATLWRMSGCDLTLIDGIGTGAAEVILTEVGPNLEAFPTEDDFISWMHLCPRTAISGGKPLAKKGKGTGANRLGGLLRLGARTLGKSKSALGAEFRRVARRKNGAVAIFALARKLGKLVYRMLPVASKVMTPGERQLG